MPVSAWSTTASLNIVSGGVSGSGGSGIQGSSSIANGNDAIQEIMAQIATFITSATYTGTSPLTLTSTDAGAAAGPILTLYRNSATPAVADVIGQILFQGEDSSGNTQDYAAINVVLADVTHPTEDGTIHFQPLVNGTLTSIMTLNGSALTVVRQVDLSSSTGGLRLPQAAAPAPTLEGDMRWDTDDDVLVVGDGAATQTIAPVKSGTVIATTSGVVASFTGIPAWVKQITVGFASVSTNGTSGVMIQLGDSGGFEGTGYLSSSTLLTTAATTATYTTGFGINSGSATNILHGSITLTLIDAVANTWVASGTIGVTTNTATITVGGSKSLSAALDRLTVATINGTDAFDLGAVNIVYH